MPALKSPSTVIVVGPLPPPVHGSAKNTAIIAGKLQDRCNVIVVDISPGSLKRWSFYHVVKIIKVLQALFVIIVQASPLDTKLYIPADAGFGTYYTITIVTLARFLGYKIFIHHRSFAYIDKRVTRMALLTRCAGSEAVHIFLCRDMKRRYLDNYPASQKALILSNGAYIKPISQIITSSFDGLRLGHLSNLGSDKGLDEVLETTRCLIAHDVKTHLVLAGPTVTTEDTQKIERAVIEFGKALDYRGAVYGEDKDRFYEDIDVFLFPTRYANEAQPNVLLEAMSFGVPSISFARGCVVGDLSQGGGIAVPTSDNFVQECLPILIDWEKNRDRLLCAKEKALARAFELRSAGVKELEKFIDTVVGTKFGNGGKRPSDQ